jgi:hypothetical protein
MLMGNRGFRWTSLAVFVMPLVMMKIVTSLLSAPPPQAATADPQDDLPALDVPALTRPAISPAQTQALHHVHWLRDQTYGQAPLFFPEEGAAPEVRTPDLEPPPRLRLQGIMSMGAGNIALIDGEAYRVGQAVADSTWTIIRIDGVTRTITIRDEASEREEIVPVDRES